MHRSRKMIVAIVLSAMALVPASPIWADGDEDGDGVSDAEDLCPRTDLAGDTPPPGHKPNRLWSRHTTAGIHDIEFFFGDPGDVPLPGSTGGCSATQIIELAGLGNGHRKYGISQGAFHAFVERIARG